MFCRFAVRCFLLVATFAGAAAAQTHGIHGIGVRGTVNGVSADGSVVVGDMFVAGRDFNEAFRWTAAGGAQGLGALPGQQGSFGAGVSGDGATVVGVSFTSSPPDRAYRWT